METDYFTKKENPFLLDIVDKEEYTVEDYLDIQAKLEEMKRRCKKGLNAKIITPTGKKNETKRSYDLYIL